MRVLYKFYKTTWARVRVVRFFM